MHKTSGGSRNLEMTDLTKRVNTTRFSNEPASKLMTVRFSIRGQGVVYNEGTGYMKKIGYTIDIFRPFDECEYIKYKYCCNHDIALLK